MLPWLAFGVAESPGEWVWLKIRQQGLRRFWSMFPRTTVPLWYRVFQSQPNGFSVRPTALSIIGPTHDSTLSPASRPRGRPAGRIAGLKGGPALPRRQLPVAQDAVSSVAGPHSGRLLLVGTSVVSRFLEADFLSCSGERHLVVLGYRPLLRVFCGPFRLS